MQPSLALGSGIWAQGSALLVIMLTAPALGASHAQGAMSMGFPPHPSPVRTAGEGGKGYLSQTLCPCVGQVALRVLTPLGRC